MRSKKFKKKKLKCKKLEKSRKLKSVNHEKNISSEISKETDCEENLLEKIMDNRLNRIESSRSYIEDDYISDVKYFSEIREGYFRYLQTVVSDNCVFCESLVTDDILETLALELEQNALLACLQVNIYKKSMLKIIKDIKKSTQEKQVHKDVKKLLPGSLAEKPVEINSLKTATSFSVEETYSRIPTIASSRTDNDLVKSTDHWGEQLNYFSNPYYSVTGEFSENPVDTNSHIWLENESYSSVPDHSNYWVNEESEKNSCNTNVFDYSKSESVIQSLVVENNSSEISSKSCTTENTSNQCEEVLEKIDPLLFSRNQLQKSVEQTLNDTEKINKQKRDEQEKAYIAQILEGDDSFDDKFNDSLSDNENECKENVDESNLMDRLEKMRELFGMEEEVSHNEVVLEKQKPYNKVSHVNIRNQRPTIWKYEKFIQLHKYSIIAAEMSLERRQINQKLFAELFEEDSDEEHESEYTSTEKFRLCCTERISSWVVKYLMPFYHEKRILGRNVFKSLGHYVSDTIVDKIQYPDEWTVKYLVSKFFPPKKKYVCEADILNFCLD